MITLRYQSTFILLSDRLQWVNEMSWSEIEQSTEYATNGALMVDQAEKLAGRPIELDGVESQAWLNRSTCLQIKQLIRIRGAVLALELRGETRNVIFDRQKGGFDAQPIWKLVDGEFTGDVLYRPTLRFLEV